MRRDANSEFLDPEPFAQGLWARIQYLTSKYIEKTQQVVTEATHKVIIRYMDGITDQMQVRSGVQIFNIESVIDPDERKVELWLFCYEREGGRQ